jgi:hypothetical protein
MKTEEEIKQEIKELEELQRISDVDGILKYKRYINAMEWVLGIDTLD